MTWNILKLRIHLNTSGLCFFELSDAGLWRNILQWAQLQSAAIANGVLITHVLERLEELGLSQNLCMGGMAETGSSAAKAAQRYPALSHLPQMTSFLQKNGALVASNGDPALLHPLKLRKCLWIARSILSSCYFCRACPFIVLLFTAHTEYIRGAFSKASEALVLVFANHLAHAQNKHTKFIWATSTCTRPKHLALGPENLQAHRESTNNMFFSKRNKHVTILPPPRA